MKFETKTGSFYNLENDQAKRLIEHAHKLQLNDLVCALAKHKDGVEEYVLLEMTQEGLVPAFYDKTIEAVTEYLDKLGSIKKRLREARRPIVRPNE